MLQSPPNGSTVTVGNNLSWHALAGAHSYRVCLKKSSAQPASAGDFGACDWGSNWMHTTFYKLTATELANLGSGPVYWTVTACKQGWTGCTYHYDWRRINISYGTPQVLFRNLYPIIASRRCESCHPSSGVGGKDSPLFPQKPDGARTCQQKTIPFNTSISAADMRGRLFCLDARSTDGNYSQAKGKVYVVPGQSASSGLHWKAQTSTAPVFGEAVTIGGVTKPLREWITIWIEQGAYH